MLENNQSNWKHHQKCLLFIRNNPLKILVMSKKSGKGKGKKSKKSEVDVESLVEGSEDESTASGAVEIGYLTSAILDYYNDTGEQTLDEGDEWKQGTKYAPKVKSAVPKELDEEIKKAFLVQIKKFQK